MSTLDPQAGGDPQQQNAQQQDDIPAERAQFRALILANPNYFGNIADSPFQPVLSIAANTFYEELGCVGFQPQFNHLHAVVYVNQSGGYGGDICSSGSQEYVRFYLSGDNGATWQDVGLTAFSAFDIAEGTQGRGRLEYAVALRIDPAKRFCAIYNVLQVRAILSWNVPPPPDTPNFVPVWGNTHDTNIVVDPIKFLPIADLLEAAQLKLPSGLEQLFDLRQPISAVVPKALSAAKLQALYQGEDVPPHRFALPELQKYISQPALLDNLMSPQFPGLLPELGINWDGILDQLFPVDSSTVFEELECIGLDPNQNALVGVLRIKRSNGYSGDPCTAGSREYVTFWGDFDNNGSFETCLGTTAVTVYDITPLPQGGLEYSVFLPVNLEQYRRTCQEGPVVVPIRAILSWESAPPCANPDFVPVWGNRLETLVHILSGRGPVIGHTPNIETVGSMAVGKIDGDGYATGIAVLAGFTAKESPFGGEVVITGHLANPVDISGGATPLRYRLTVNDGSGDEIITNGFWISLTQWLDTGWTILPDVWQEATDGFYTYREDLTGGPGNPQTFVSGNVLARWQTAGRTGKWTIRIDAKDAAGVIYPGTPVTVRLDNAGPQFPPNSFRITSGGGSCADFFIGDVIEGTYAVTDEHFNALNLAVLPGLGGTFTAPVPLPRTYPTVSTNGEAGGWRLDTTGMPKCGYVIRLSASDRTIVNSGFVGFYNDTVLGLCLREQVAP